MDKRFYYLCFALAFFLGTSYFVLFYRQRMNSFPKDSTLPKSHFSDWRKAKEKLPQKPEKVVLIAVGDISFSRGVERMVKAQGDIDYPLAKVRDYLNGGDLVFGNLETTITSGREILDNEMVFRSDPGTEKALKQAGFSLLSLANNHTSDFGQKGVLDTLNYLHQTGISYVGAGQNEQEAYKPVYLEKNGIKFAFLAYTDQSLVPSSYEAGEEWAGSAFMRIERMERAIKQAKKEADLVIVAVHGGIEYTPEPNNRQKDFSQAAIDAGADLIIGHHPHVVQTMEKYQGKFIFYSLGNFVFDQMWSRETKEALALKIYFSPQGVSRISFLPVVIENFSQPRPANDKESEKILQRLKFPLSQRAVYSWDEKKGSFKKITRAAIYNQPPETRNIISKQSSGDLDENSIGEVYFLDKGRLTIQENSQVVWQSPGDWWIDDFVLADSTNDGVVDLNLSVWKAGSYGETKPFWVEENDWSIKNHFFVFNLQAGKVKPVWQSSNLVRQNQELAIVDVNNDGKNELIVLEKDYPDQERCQNNYLAVWQWSDWGFAKEWQSEKGNFCHLEIEKINSQTYIAADSL